MARLFSDWHTVDVRTNCVTSCIDVFTADLIDTGVEAAAEFQSRVMESTNNLNRDDTASFVNAADTSFRLTNANQVKDAGLPGGVEKVLQKRGGYSAGSGRPTRRRPHGRR